MYNLSFKYKLHNLYKQPQLKIGLYKKMLYSADKNTQMPKLQDHYCTSKREYAIIRKHSLSFQVFYFRQSTIKKNDEEISTILQSNCRKWQQTQPLYFMSNMLSFHRETFKLDTDFFEIYYSRKLANRIWFLKLVKQLVRA